MPPVSPDAVAQRNGPAPSSEAVRTCMKACAAGRDTKPEILVRRELHSRGVRFRIGTSVSLPGRRAVRPDLVWKGRRLAVFIDGCFWHVCPEHHVAPRSNPGYWLPKLRRNAERDAEQTAALEALGWTVLRFWEHESASSVADAVEEALDARASCSSAASGTSA